jgi:hypothetical protein
MIADYPIQANTRTCAATGRPLHPGDRVFSTLTYEEGQLVRRDFSAEAWHGPPAGCLAHWVSRVPAHSQKRRLTFDDELMMECFERLAEETDWQKIQLRYVLGLLLMRRRRLRFADVKHVGSETRLILSCPRTNLSYEVVDPQLTEADIQRVQDELIRGIGGE